MKRIALVLLLLFCNHAYAQSCTTTLSSGGNIGTAITSSANGDVICLSDGSYSGFTVSGTTRSPRVLVRAVNPLGASITTGVTIQSNASGFTFSGMNFVGVFITGANTSNLTFRDYNATGKFEIDAVTIATPNILFENFTHNNIDVATAPNARIHFSFAGRSTSLATIRRATIDGGCADGIQSGVPFILEQSYIANMQVGACAGDPHTDAVQLYGGPFTGTIIRNNYFYRNVQALTAYDGVDGVLIQHNVFDPGPDGERRDCQIEWYTDTGSTIEHNTILDRSGTLGYICLDRKLVNAVGSGTIVRNNIAIALSVNNGSTAATNTNNLYTSGGTSPNFSGTPTYTGGSTPTTWQGFRLTSGSTGHAAATDGKDVGANFFNPPAPTGVH